ncbi:unnamed protein product, partial [Rotaria sp. Silwood1]
YPAFSGIFSEDMVLLTLELQQ